MQFHREKEKVQDDLNVKQLNTIVDKIHFKMETLESCVQIMQQNCYVASLDLSNAYFTIPVHQRFWKYFKFQMDDDLYCFMSLPQGFRDSPRVFTKIFKPVLAHLRHQGIIVNTYIDDIYIQGKTYVECKNNVTTVAKLITLLGFSLSEKSVFNPSRKIDHLGFHLDSEIMTVSLRLEKREKLRCLAISFMEKYQCTIKELSKLIGSLIATFPAVPYGQLFYRAIEERKISSLRIHHGNYDKTVKLSDNVKNNIKWWIDEGLFSYKPVYQRNPNFKLTTDASLIAWGAHMNGQSSQGFWSREERIMHINVLELKAIHMGLSSLCSELKDCHVLICSDNKTAVTYINKMGGMHSHKCNEIARNIVPWVKERKMWLTAIHIPGKENGQADNLSRQFNDNLEWSISQQAYDTICLTKGIGYPTIDLFASCLNNKLPKYASFYPDPMATHINAFSFKWEEYIYAFPPFNLISKVLTKIQHDKTIKMLVIVPYWFTQPWFPNLINMLQQPSAIT